MATKVLNNYAAGENTLGTLAASAAVGPAMDRMLAYRNANAPDVDPRYWAVVNFDLHSATPRLFLFDRRDSAVTSYLCAHGRGSEGKKDDGFAEIFSNEVESHRTCLGIFRTGDTYNGDHGYSLRLHGLELSNSKALKRKIVMHAATYVSPGFAKKYGRIGRSKGCPAVEHKYARHIIDSLRNGSFLIHWKTGT